MKIDYRFSMPKAKRYMKPIHILDSSDKEVGTVKLFYKNKLDELLDRFLSLFNKSNYSCQLANQDGGVMLLPLNIKDTLFKQRWKLQDPKAQTLGTLVNESKIKTNPIYSYQTEMDNYRITHDLLSKQVEIRTSSGGIIASATYEGVVFIGEIKVTFHEKSSIRDEEILLLKLIAIKPMD